jgi:hypothetical protein
MISISDLSFLLLLTAQFPLEPPLDRSIVFAERGAWNISCSFAMGNLTCTISDERRGMKTLVWGRGTEWGIAASDGTRVFVIRPEAPVPAPAPAPAPAPNPNLPPRLNLRNLCGFQNCMDQSTALCVLAFDRDSDGGVSLDDFRLVYRDWFGSTP